MYLVIKTNKEERQPGTRGRKPTVVAPPTTEVLAFPTFDLLSAYVLRSGLENCKVFEGSELNLKLTQAEVKETASVEK
jgi:hypothetical protein